VGSSVRHIIEQGGVRYAFAGSVIYRNESSIVTGLASSPWASMLYNSYNDTTEQVFATNGIDRKRIQASTAYEWGIAAPTAAPTITTGAKTGLTGAYNAKYTYCRKVGSVVVCESNPSPAAAAAVTLANGSLSVTWTASSDAQVTHVRVYRTLTGGATYYHDQDIAIGTVAVDTTTADGSLGSEAASTHDRPPTGGTCMVGPNYNGTCFMAVGNLLYYCLPKQPEYWPAAYYIEVSPIQYPMKSVVFFNGQPYCLTTHEIYVIQGTGADSFFPYRCNALTGCKGPNAAYSIAGKGIYHVGSDGVYLFNGSEDHKISQAHFEPIFNGQGSGGMPGMSGAANSWVIALGNKVYIGYVSSGYTYPTNVLVFNMDTNRTTYHSYPMEIRSIEVDEYGGRLLGGDTGGNIWHLENPDATADQATAISWEIQSKEFMLQTRAHFPRWCKYDVDATDASVATGAVILEDEIHQSHILTGLGRNGRKRLVQTGNGQRMAIRLTGTGPVSIYAVEAE
jgi:hypothetical protein